MYKFYNFQAHHFKFLTRGFNNKYQHMLLSKCMLLLGKDGILSLFNERLHLKVPRRENFNTVVSYTIYSIYEF